MFRLERGLEGTSTTCKNSPFLSVMNLRILVYLITLLATFVITKSAVYDVRSRDKLAFPEDLIALVLEVQSRAGKVSFKHHPEDLEDGYVINEEGQLVPFRIYKKGVHPRNCPGGFRKRSLEQTPAVLRKRANIKEEVYSLETDYEYPNNDADFYPSLEQLPGPVRADLQKAPDGSYLYTILNER